MNAAHSIAASLLAAGVLVVGCAGASKEDRVTPQASSPPPSTESSASGFVLKSPAFEDGEPIPAEHATARAGGRNLSIPLEWSSAPSGTRSIAVEVVDLHPIARQWVHWLAIDMPAATESLPAGASGTSMPPGAQELANGFGDAGWDGPQPPKGSGAHTYQVTVYALDAATLALPRDTSLGEFREAVDGHVLASASLTGTFER